MSRHDVSWWIETMEAPSGWGAALHMEVAGLKWGDFLVCSVEGRATEDQAIVGVSQAIDDALDPSQAI